MLGSDVRGAWLVAMAGAVCWASASAGAQEAGMKRLTLRQAAGDRIVVGTAIAAAHLDDPAHAELIRTQFGSITPENEMKPQHLQPQAGRFTFERADKIVDFAHANDMEVIGHTLVWHQQSPKWLFEDEQGKPLPREVALANMKSHIEGVVGHYRGRVRGWDVVNEAIPDGPGDLRDTPARRAIGDDYLVQAFKFAQAADPDAELYYNDYNIELDYKRERGVKLVRSLLEAGVRLDGVGIQAHWGIDGPPIAEIDRGIRAYTDLGVKVMITELDVDVLPRKEGPVTADLNAAEREGLDPYRDGLPPEMQQKLAERYAAIFRLLVSHPQVKRVTIWGTHDAHSWLNNFPVRGRTNHAMLWDRQYQPKPAFDAVLEVLSGQGR